MEEGSPEIDIDQDDLTAEIEVNILVIDNDYIQNEKDKYQMK